MMPKTRKIFDILYFLQGDKRDSEIQSKSLTDTNIRFGGAENIKIL